MLVPQPGGKLCFGSSSAAITKPSRITRSGEIRPAEYMLLLENEELSGEGASVGLSIPDQESLSVGVVQRTPHERPAGTLGIVFPRHVQLNLSQDGIVV